MATDFNDFPVFRGLNATQIENFVAACVEETHAVGTALMAQGGRGDSIYFVHEGEVSISIVASDGPRELATITAPAVLGEMEFLTGEPRSATVTCTTPVRTLRIDFESLRSRVADGDPATLKIFFNISNVLAHRLAAMDQKLSEIEIEQPERTADLVAFHRKLFGEWNI